MKRPMDISLTGIKSQVGTTVSIPSDLSRQVKSHPDFDCNKRLDTSLKCRQLHLDTYI